jgi:alpha-L-fucosidase
MSRLKTRIVCLIVIVGLLSGCATQPSRKKTIAVYKADWKSLRKHNPAPEWFRDAKFGIYFHWGVYSVPAFANEWYPRNMHNKNSGEYKHHVQKYGEPTEFGYHNFVPMFKAEKFNADEWAELFEKAGARFAGLVAEHHDGFSMWDSDLTPWNAMDTGPKRDIVGELATAIRKRGMRFVTTFHHARNNLYQIERGNTRDGPATTSSSKNTFLYCSKTQGRQFYMVMCRVGSFWICGKANSSKSLTNTSRT